MRYGNRYNGGWPEYVPVALRKKNAEKKTALLKKKNSNIAPVVIEGRNIANTFWGRAWCDNIESYADFENRLARGRSYVRNGSIADLSISKGDISAMVHGSSLYTVKITIIALENQKWQILIDECAGKIDSLIELLQGKFSQSVMKIITERKSGLFPQPDEISLQCSCPDFAVLCKHVAAALYGVGARLDEQPEKLFMLRQVDHIDLIKRTETALKFKKSRKKVLADADLSSIFGIEIQND